MAFSVSGSFTEDQIKKLNIISNDKANETRKKSQVLDKDAFLKLMMVQLQNQNPLNPTDNTEYMNQMAQFSSVEQLSNIAKSQESNTQMSALISKQIEELNTLLKKSTGTSSSDEVVKTQKEIIEQNSKVLAELVKMNALLSSYVGSNSNTNKVTNEDVYSALGL